MYVLSVLTQSPSQTAYTTCLASFITRGDIQQAGSGRQTLSVEDARAGVGENRRRVLPSISNRL
eukprot:COSAG01_NODE_31720_length_592_cov_2.018256_2_plen_63_part_01